MNYKRLIPALACIVALFNVFKTIISQKFGTYPNYIFNPVSGELIGVVIILTVLIIPLFLKAVRDDFWNKENLLLLLSTLLICVIVISVFYINREYYYTLWFNEGAWTRDNCPPIRWDIWNIVGKTA